jgi:hypothetical protein
VAQSWRSDGTSLGFMGVIVSATTLTGNNIGLWIVGG